MVASELWANMRSAGLAWEQEVAACLKAKRLQKELYNAFAQDENLSLRVWVMAVAGLAESDRQNTNIINVWAKRVYRGVHRNCPTAANPQSGHPSISNWVIQSLEMINMEMAERLTYWL